MIMYEIEMIIKCFNFIYILLYKNIYLKIILSFYDPFIKINKVRYNSINSSYYFLNLVTRTN